ncbi:iron-siderophore ABC transporter substrate-binding protein [Chlorogloeopsis fritschii]|uniref:iron-siderophore ABC transporter substrate-binding protein n=1 Tax=Chlorogloeopsis fritschii TaxID=1124 RepID=UPI0023F49019|nr:iron-siderophore ABC transporter substrate-binding protein [Chlorogloeopsis fritschii]
MMKFRQVWKLYRYILKKRLHLFFILTLTFLLVTACHSKPIQNLHYTKTQSAASECRIVRHKLGRTCVPLNPQRLIVLNEEVLEAVLALGVKPVAAAEHNWVTSRGRQFGNKAEGIISIGESAQPNLEKIVQLNPDLILGEYINAENYQLFSQIAPTVALDYDVTAWKEAFLYIGEVLGKSTQAQEILSQYQKRVTEFQNAMGEELGKIKVSVSRFYAGSLETEFRTIFSFPGHLLSEIGLASPKIQQQLTPKDFPRVAVSMERVDLLDADVLFAVLDPGSEKHFQQYQKNLLWQRLNVVKNNRVYSVESGYWIFGNILSANTILDDLNKYLLQK